MVAALPAGILASSFSEQAHQKREIFKLKIKQALVDGKITQRELAELEQLRHSLDIERGEAQMKFSMMDDRNAKKAATVCPHCHRTI